MSTIGAIDGGDVLLNLARGATRKADALHLWRWPLAEAALCPAFSVCLGDGGTGTGPVRPAAP